MNFDQFVLEESYKDARRVWNERDGYPIEEIDEMINIFRKLSQKNILAGQMKDISYWIPQHFSSFQARMKELENVKSKKDVKKEIKHAGTDIILDNAEVLILLLKTHAAAVYYGKETKWCVSSSHEDCEMDIPADDDWNRYNNKGVNIYVVIDKRLKRKYAVSVNPIIKHDDVGYEYIDYEEMSVWDAGDFNHGIDEFPIVNRYRKYFKPRVYNDPESVISLFCSYSRERGSDLTYEKIDNRNFRIVCESDFFYFPKDFQAFPKEIKEIYLSSFAEDVDGVITDSYLFKMENKILESFKSFPNFNDIHSMTISTCMIKSFNRFPMLKVGDGPISLKLLGCKIASFQGIKPCFDNLFLTNCDIMSLKGLENIPALDSLFMSSSTIKNRDLKYLPQKIYHLDISEFYEEEIERVKKDYKKEIVSVAYL